MPPGLVPAGSPGSETAFEGKQLAAPLRQGQLLTDAQILGPGLLAGSPPGSAAVPLRMADPASVQLVSPGQLVNVVLTGGNGFEQPGESQILAEAVPVLWTSVQGGKAGPWPATAETDGLMVVAAAADQARRLAGASTQGKLFFVLVAAPPGLTASQQGVPAGPVARAVCSDAGRARRLRAVRGQRQPQCGGFCSWSQAS